MKLKSKILMAVFAVLFLVAGNAFAIPVDVTYTVYGNNLNFSITNNIAGFDFYAFGLEYNGVATVVPTGMSDSASTYPTNGITYNKFSIDHLAYDATISGLIVNVGVIPFDGTVDFYAFGKLNGSYYMYNGVAVDPPGQVPEPTTLLLLGFGLVGLAGLRRKK